MLEGLDVDPGEMRRNLESGGGFLMAEAVMMGLAPQIGRNHAHKLVQTVSNRAIEQGTTLRAALLTEPEVTNRLREAEIDALLEPGNYTGSAGAMVDAVLARVEAQGGAA